MASPSYQSAQFDPAAQQLFMTSHPSPRSAHPWKSVFRLPSASSKKPSANSTLSVNTTLFPATNVPNTSATANLTPSSFLFDQRSSYNSSTTQSTDSTGARTPFHHGSANRSYPPYHRQQEPKSTDALSTRTRIHTKSERQRTNLSRNPNSPHPKPLTADPSQASFTTPSMWIPTHPRV